MEVNRDIRKFVDLVRQTSGKWANWDAPVPIVVGDYGTLDENGELHVEGNIYTAEFQDFLNENGFDLNLRDYPPELGDPEQDYIVASSGVRRREFDVDVSQNVNVPGIASASIKGTWKFQSGKRGLLIALHKPRQRIISKLLQTKIIEVELLEGKKLVTSVLACPAYLLYVSDKSGETFSAAFCGRADPAVTSGLESGWWTSGESARTRRAFDSKGEYCFTPLFSLRSKAKRGSRSPWLPKDGESKEYVWQDVYQPWKPLDDDGEEVDD